jgi:predicted phage gp36 major capsid-like protein
VRFAIKKLHVDDPTMASELSKSLVWCEITLQGQRLLAAGRTHAVTLDNKHFANFDDELELSFAIEDARNLQYSVKQQYRNAPKSGFLMSDATLGTVLGITSSSLPLFQPGGQGGVDRLLGKPVYTASGIADIGDNNKPILFGDLGQIKTALV